MTQSSGHMQQLNSGNEGHNIGGGMGVFYGGADRLIIHHSSFLDGTAPTQRGNYFNIRVATSALQYATYLDSSSLLRAAQTSM